MKASVKRLLDTLQALGFESEPHHQKPWISVWRHANQPDDQIKVWNGMADGSARDAIALAHRIADTGSTGPAPAKEVRTRHRRKKQSETARRQREKAAYFERVADKERRDENAARERFARENDRGHLSLASQMHFLDRIDRDWLTRDDLIEQLLVSPRRVKEAVNSGALTERVIGPGPKIAIATSEVRQWLKTA